MKSSTLFRSFALLTLGAGLAHSSVTLNAPISQSGFYDGNTDYFALDGTGFLNSISSVPLPDVNGLASQKLYGSATLGTNGSFQTPYIVMVAQGTASGSFDTDVNLYLHFNYTATSSDPSWAFGIPTFVSASVATTNGPYDLEFSGFFLPNDPSGVSVLGKNGITGNIPAGTEIISWEILVGVGSYGTVEGPPDLTFSIPQNSVELIATPNGVDPDPGIPGAGVPEPSTILLGGGGLATLWFRRRSRT